METTGIIGILERLCRDFRYRYWGYKTASLGLRF